MKRFHRRLWALLGSSCLGQSGLVGVLGFLFPSSMWRRMALVLWGR
jgi:hypothetical protein